MLVIVFIAEYPCQPDKAGCNIAKCKFGMLCGGGVNVTVYKENGIFKIRKASSWSD